MADGTTVTVAAETLRRQLAAIFGAWGMPGEHVEETVANMLWADLSGIDSHGVAMLPLYAQFREAGKLSVKPDVKIVEEWPTGAAIDADGGLGHYPGTFAMRTAIAKAREMGMASTTVRNSNHYGAAGVYATMAAEAGLIGISMTNVHKPYIVPTFGTEPMFGTNPIAFAAPSQRNGIFLLDMATSTAALGKLKVASMAGKTVPEGWALDGSGQPLTDPDEALKKPLLTPVGGTRELGSHKGYGLAMMVEILTACLSGASFAPTRIAKDPDALRSNVGHFMLALDPARFRPGGAFGEALDEMVDTLRSSKPVDPARPVMVAGDPERASQARRSREGIPIPAVLVEQVRSIAASSGAAFLLA